MFFILLVERTTNGGDRFVSSFTFDEIRKLDCAYQFEDVDHDTGKHSYTLRYVTLSYIQTELKLRSFEPSRLLLICRALDFVTI